MEDMEQQLTVAGEEDTQRGKYLTFELGKETFGIEIKFVTEIIGIQPITFVPEVPDYVKGIINLRGKVIPVIDMRLKFKKEPIGYTDRTCIIVIDIEEILLGLIVDSVAEVMNINDENIVPPPSYKTGFQNRYIKGIGKVDTSVVLLLDCKKLISDDDLDAINNAAQ
ncbi:MAG: chemotaxis protein CheW [Ethanoligenens sp.]|uniref:chemotaxis protein CheW n=1 Tax=Ethanoligenens sp. TaxID=2099655 RepID=UPI0039E7E582